MTEASVALLEILSLWRVLRQKRFIVSKPSNTDPPPPKKRKKTLGLFRATKLPFMDSADEVITKTCAV